jgi:hypothetical protein
MTLLNDRPVDGFVVGPRLVGDEHARVGVNRCTKGVTEPLERARLKGVRLSVPIDASVPHDSRQVADLSNPAAVRLAIELYRELQFPSL